MKWLASIPYIYYINVVCMYIRVWQLLSCSVKVLFKHTSTDESENCLTCKDSYIGEILVQVWLKINERMM